MADCFIDAVKKYGTNVFDASNLKAKIGDRPYATLLQNATDILPEGFGIKAIDENGHLAAIEEQTFL